MLMFFFVWSYLNRLLNLNGVRTTRGGANVPSPLNVAAKLMFLSVWSYLNTEVTKSQGV